MTCGSLLLLLFFNLLLISSSTGSSLIFPWKISGASSAPVTLQLIPNKEIIFIVPFLLSSVKEFSLSPKKPLILGETLENPWNGKPNGVCISQGGRFPPFSSEGKAPRKVTKGPKDLTLCRVFRRRTCCDVAQTHQAFVTIRRLASLGEANEECLQLWELLECSICDPRVGVQPGPPLICASLCESVYKACSNAYFSIDMKTQVLSPCGLSNLVCGRVSEWASNGTELCHLAGFAIKSSEDSYQTGKEPSCYGGKASLDSIADSWKSSYSGIPQKTENFGSFEDFQQWVREMPFNERVSWAIGGMVLTAGLLFVSKRRSHAQRQRQVALLWTARRLEAKMNPQSPPVSPGNRKKGSGR